MAGQRKLWVGKRGGGAWFRAMQVPKTDPLYSPSISPHPVQAHSRKNGESAVRTRRDKRTDGDKTDTTTHSRICTCGRVHLPLCCAGPELGAGTEKWEGDTFLHISWPAAAARRPSQWRIGGLAGGNLCTHTFHRHRGCRATKVHLARIEQATFGVWGWRHSH